MTHLDGLLQSKILANVSVIAEGCWIWQGYWDRTTGYARLKWNRQSQWAHRLSYEAFVGLIPARLQIDHLCRTPLCVNPTHLEAVASLINNQRSANPKFDLSRTRCPSGHEFTPDNTIRDAAGTRRCRTCRRNYDRRRRGMCSLQTATLADRPNGASLP